MSENKGKMTKIRFFSNIRYGHQESRNLTEGVRNVKNGQFGEFVRFQCPKYTNIW